MSLSPPLAEQAIALNRFGLGARPDDQPVSDPRRWLLDQFDRYEAAPALYAAAETSAGLALIHAEVRMETAGEDRESRMTARQAMRRRRQALYRSEVDMRGLGALATPAPFVERLAHFWSNHFAISANKPRVTMLAGAFEREAIRPHVLGRFEDMLLAVERHPAMLLFLDQVRSIGPTSLAARKAETRDARRRPGINENLAREIMELHTLGVRSGYDQKDVTEFALALTGWSIGRFRTEGRPEEPGAFFFRPRQHEPGPRRIMTRTYNQPGEAQAIAVLRDLASSEATAKHIATKLVRHFVSDEPPAAAVTRLSDAFLRSGGDLPTVYRALVDLPEAWASKPVKFKSPWEWAVSALRGLGRRDLEGLPLAPLMTQLGQPVWRPGSPAGYDDTAGTWATPDALVRRVEASQRLVAKTGIDVDPRTLARKLFPDSLGSLIEQEVARAESAHSGFALLLASPDFQRR